MDVWEQNVKQQKAGILILNKAGNDYNMRGIRGLKQKTRFKNRSCETVHRVDASLESGNW